MIYVAGTHDMSAMQHLRKNGNADSDFRNRVGYRNASKPNDSDTQASRHA